MATRKAASTPDAQIDLVALFVMLAEFDSTQENPTTTQELVGELGEHETAVYNALEVLADAELIDSVAGTRGLTCKWFIIVPDVSADNAESIAKEALATTTFGKVAETPKRTRRTKAQIAADKEAARERTEYGARVAESQDAVMSQIPTEVAHAIATERAVKAVTPVVAADGTNVTIPVDFNDPSKGRRELDASQGERLIGEDDMREVVATWTPTFSEPKNEPYEGPETLPAVPAGVTENTWFMAHCADTESARTWWMARATAQEEEHKLNQGEPAPF